MKKSTLIILGAIALVIAIAYLAEAVEPESQTAVEILEADQFAR